MAAHAKLPNLAMYTASTHIEEQCEYSLYSIPSIAPVEFKWSWQKTKPERKKRKTASLEAKIIKTNKYHNVKETHWKKQLCLKSLQYTAHGNIPPHVEFKNKIKTIKHTAEGAYVLALTKFHYHCLEKQEVKQE